MKTKADRLATHTNYSLSKETLKRFFISHLDRIYCAKSHLQERLPEMRDYANFTDLAHAITEMLVDVEKQITRMNNIYELLAVKPHFDDCKGMIGMIEDTFDAIYQETNDRPMRDLSILFYLQNIESIEVASFKMLKLASPQVDKKAIKQLLQENLDEASDDLKLLYLITAAISKPDHN